MHGFNMSNMVLGHDEHGRAWAKLYFLKIAAMPEQNPYFAPKYPFHISARASMRALQAQSAKERFEQKQPLPKVLLGGEIHLLCKIYHLSNEFLDCAVIKIITLWMIDLFFKKNSRSCCNQNGHLLDD